jgi:YesN/AraC family two-component response regulator
LGAAAAWGFQGLRMSHTILIADDSPFIREFSWNVFEREEDFDICGKAEKGKEALEKAQELHPDLIPPEIRNCIQGS